MTSVQDLPSEDLTRGLTYAGLVLVGFDLVKSMIVGPIKAFYTCTTFAQGMLFKSYDEDVRARHSNEFEACLLYLRDFMEAIDSADMVTIQELRTHRNELAHNLAVILPTLRIDEYRLLWEKVDRTLFKLSNYRTRMEIGADPKLQAIGIDWESAKGHEYLLFEHLMESVTLLNLRCKGA
jgi:hypothetical protein